MNVGTVYIVDDDPDVRRSVVALVGEMGVETREFDSAESFLDHYDRQRPACLLTDVRMVGMSGLELQEELAREGIGISVIVLTAFANTSSTIRAIQNGAITLLEKPCNDQQLWDSIRFALTKDAKNFEIEEKQNLIESRMAKLSKGESDVLQHMIEGDANKVIAANLNVSVRTVEVSRHNIFEKMQADSLAELIRLVLQVESKNA